jgi:hypothetical protein
LLVSLKGEREKKNIEKKEIYKEIAKERKI